ncbi:MAG: hypothetical protein AMXMBFR33_03110 [Candidatus Xenobia bacterium]|jgi:hypothetical protein
MSTQTIPLDLPWKPVTPRRPQTWMMPRSHDRRRRRRFERAFRRLLNQMGRLARCTELREGACFGLSLALMLSSLWMLGKV